MSQKDNTGIRILCLEDNPKEMAQHLISICKKFQATVSLASSYLEAENLLEKEEFHLFILDIEIENERGGGIQLAQQLRQNPKYSNTPIIFISVHAHLSHRLLTSVSHCIFLSKPFSINTLLQQVGIALNVHQYINNWHSPHNLFLEIGKSAYIEIDPHTISYIETRRNIIYVQYINGERININNEPGGFKKLLMQIKEYRIDCLRQIYRSIIVNIDQIRQIELHGNAGDVWLFGDKDPKPVGIQYRKEVKEFL